jgi:hypothetical protein
VHGFLQEEGWRPAVLGTGGIQEDRMPGASDSLHARQRDAGQAHYFIKQSYYNIPPMVVREL